MRRLSYTQSLLLACSLAVPVAAKASEEFFTELPVVLSASRLAQPLREAPGAMTVIDQEMIRVSGARLLSDVLRLVPGFQVTTARDAPRVTYHGLGEDFPSRVQVLIDGHSQYSPLFLGGVNWNLIPVALENIERIEVLRGSNSVAYGANAFLGVINIITQKAAQTPGGNIALNRGDGGINDTFARWGGKAPGADFRLSYREQADTGLDKHFDSRRNRLFNLRADLYLNSRDELELNLSHVDNALGSGNVIKPCDPAHNYRMASNALQARWRRALGPEEEIRVNYSLVQEGSGDRHFETCNAQLFNVDYGGRSLRHEIEAQHTVSLATGLRAAWGAAARFEELNLPFFFYGDVRQRRNTQRVFGNFEWLLAKDWLLNAGASLERDSLSGTGLAPRLSLHHHLNDNHSLRIGASRAFRPPSLFEARGDWRWITVTGQMAGYGFLARPGLQREEVNSRELGYVGEWRQANISIDARLFNERIPNRINILPSTLDPAACLAFPSGYPCGAASTAANAENIDIRGFEYQLRWQPLPDTRLMLNQTFVRLRSELLDVAPPNPVDGLRVLRHTEASAPRETTSLMWMQKLPGNIDFSIARHNVGAMKWTTNTNVAAYHRIDWRVAHTFRTGGKSVQVAYTGRSATTNHGEFGDRWVVTPRHFVSLQIGL